MVAELLLFGEAHAVLGVAAAAVAVHAGEREFLGGVLLDVGDRNADATGEADLRSGVTAHGRMRFLRATMARSKQARRWESRSGISNLGFQI